MKKNDNQYEAVFSTNLVTIGLQFDGEKLINIQYLANRKEKTSERKIVNTVKNKIEKYLDPSLKIKNISIAVLLNVTPFQNRVLQQLQKIPYGETRTYGDIAKILKTSPRAVGNACRNNPLPIIIPCHRVVAANDLGGYDGEKSGRLLTIKRKLLEKEGVCFQ